MRRKITSQKNGFRVTWGEIISGSTAHTWRHFFAQKIQEIKTYDNIKGKKFIRNRVWFTFCMKCEYQRVEAREVWLPGEVIPEFGIEKLKEGFG